VAEKLDASDEKVRTEVRTPPLPVDKPTNQILPILVAKRSRDFLPTHEGSVPNDCIKPAPLDKDFWKLQRPMKRELPV
jgi:hypothetical protein